MSSGKKAGWVIGPVWTLWEEKLLHCRESKPGRPARSPSIYRLSYPDSFPVEDMNNYCLALMGQAGWPLENQYQLLELLYRLKYGSATT
jgi:hypothetical protein